MTAEKREWERLHSMWMKGCSASVLETARRYIAKNSQRAAAWIVMGDCLREFARFDEALLSGRPNA